MSRGGAERRRAGDDPAPTSSGRVTAPADRQGSRRRVNWLLVIVIVLVLVGLVGGFFVSLSGGSDPATTIPTTQGP